MYRAISLFWTLWWMGWGACTALIWQDGRQWQAAVVFVSGIWLWYLVERISEDEA